MTNPFGFESGDPGVMVSQQDALEFLEALPANSINMLITDPAYNGMNQHLQLGSGRIVGDYAERGNGQWFTEFDDSAENYHRLLTQIHRVLKDDSPLFLMFDPYSLLTLAPMIREFFDVKNLITWDKMMLGMVHHWRRRSEFAIYATKGKFKMARRDAPDIIRIKRIHRADYPTQKPVELFEAMIAACYGDTASKDIIICDPFMGSGSTAIAAIRQGCSFVGCDIADESIAMTLERAASVLEGEGDPGQPESLVNEYYQKEFWVDSRVI